MNPSKTSRLLTIVALVQGFYYAATGIWPLVSISSFQAVTGPKVDHWLVKAVAVLVLASGIVIMTAALRKRISLEIMMLAVGEAFGLAAIDFVYAMSDRISSIYLLDAWLEVSLVALWILAWTRQARRERSPAVLTSSARLFQSGKRMPGGRKMDPVRR